jgi:hypothetical protein
MNTISDGGTSAAMFQNTRVDLARPQPVQYTRVEGGPASISDQGHPLRACSGTDVTLRGNPRDFIPQVFSLVTYRDTCCENMRPINVSAIESLSEMCLVSLLGRPRGRPMERHMGERERKRQDTLRRAITQGALPDVPDNAPQRCQQCNYVGHLRTWTEIIRFAGDGL